MATSLFKTMTQKPIILEKAATVRLVKPHLDLKSNILKKKIAFPRSIAVGLLVALFFVKKFAISENIYKYFPVKTGPSFLAFFGTGGLVP